MVDNITALLPCRMFLYLSLCIPDGQALVERGLFFLVSYVVVFAQL